MDSEELLKEKEKLEKEVELLKDVLELKRQANELLSKIQSERIEHIPSPVHPWQPYNPWDSSIVYGLSTGDPALIHFHSV